MIEVVPTNGVSSEELAAFIERVERVQGEIDGLNADKSDIFKEMRGRGFDVKIVREIIRIRKQDHAVRQEHDAILELYLQALGMA
jgi:uncharacterized protein (UPF0335 family)